MALCFCSAGPGRQTNIESSFHITSEEPENLLLRPAQRQRFPQQTPAHVCSVHRAAGRQDLGKRRQSSRSVAVSFNDFNSKEHCWPAGGVLALACASCLQPLRSEIVIILQSSATIETPSSCVKLHVTAAVGWLISCCVRDKLRGVAACSEPVGSVVFCCKGRLENAVGVWCYFSSNFNFDEFSLLALTRR